MKYFVFIIPVTFPHFSHHFSPAPLSRSELLITCFPDKWLAGKGEANTLFFEVTPNKTVNSS